VAEIITLETDLSRGQINKFNCLFKSMKIRNGRAYLLIHDMHGVLLTNSRNSAVNIVRAHSQLIKPHQEGDYLRPSGVYVLLEALCDENPAKALGYRASIAYITATLANHAELAKSTQIAAAVKQRSTVNTINDIKRKATHCVLSGFKFDDNVECHIHHIEGKSEQPDLVDEPSNLIPLAAKVHIQYHEWVSTNNKSITRQTLKEFAKRNGYSSKLTA
jgi:hypothetical protein